MTQAHPDPNDASPAVLPFPREAIEATVHGRFEAAAEHFGQRPAIHSPTLQWTYADLNRRANAVARALRGHTDTRGTRVALMYPHEGTMVAAMLGTLKAGGTYIPLDPNLPDDRIAYILEDSGARILVTDAAHAGRGAALAASAGLACLDTDALTDAVRDDNPDVGAEPDDSAYILYTSGSTGQPKGVLQTHRGLLHHIQVWTQELSIHPHDRMTLVSAFTWDSALQDTYGALLNGAAAYVFDVREQGFERLADLLLEQELSICHLAVPVYRNLVKVLMRREARPGAVRVMGLGADMVHEADVEAFRTLFSDQAVIVNAFGATESTTASIFRMGRDTSPPRYPLPIGRPVEATDVQLVDDHGQPVPDTETGEITITSRYVAHGYLNRPELNAEKFRPDPDDPALRTYMTGDLGQRLPDGNLVLLGRRDNQIKIRGMRVDLGEIEATLVQHADVLEAVVLDQPHPAGDKRLAAYVVPGPHGGPDPADLRAFLGTKLPEYMHPAAFIELAALPLTPNGKVNRKILPQPDWSARIAHTEYVGPRNDREADLTQVFAEVLGLEAVGIHDHFLELGGDSLLALDVVLRAEQRGLRILPRQIFAHPTVAGLAAVAQTPPTAGMGEAGARPEDSERLEQWDQLKARLPDPDQVEHLYPVSPTQKGIYYQCLMARRDSGIYMEQTRLTLSGALDPDVFAQAWEHLFERHAPLRTAFVRRGLGNPHQVVARGVSLPLRFEDWRSKSADAQRADLEAEQAHQLRQGLGLAKAPLMRLVLIRTGEDSHEFIWTYHHILMDGWSESLLLNDLFIAYAALARNEPPELPARTPYRMYIDWLQDQDPAASEAFWRDLLAGYTRPLRLGERDRDHSPADPTQAFGAAELELAHQPLLQAGRALQVSPSTLMQGIWALALARASGRDDLVFGTVTSGRELGLPGIGDVIGLVVNTLPLRVRFEPEMRLDAWLQGLQSELPALREHAASDLGEIEKLSELPTEQRPLLESAFVYLNLPAAETESAEAPPFRITGRDFRSVPHYPLTLFVDPGEPLRLRLVYRYDTFSVDRAERLLEDVARVARQVPAAQKEPLGRLLEL